MSRKLTPKEAAFVREYLVDLNASAACLRARYQTRNPNVMGAKLMAREVVREAIKAAIDRQAARVEVKADDVLRELMRLAYSNLGDFYRPDGTLKPMNELNEDQQRALLSVESDELVAGGAAIGVKRKIRLQDKKGALDSLMRHLGLFIDKTEITGKDGGPIAVEDARAKVREKLLGGAIAGGSK